MDKNIPTKVLLQAKNGDERALSKVFAHMLPIIHKIAFGAMMPGLDFDDAVQEGLLGLFSAIQTFELGHGATFSTYASTCMRNSVLSAQRQAGGKKHAVLSHSIPLTDVATSTGPEDYAIAGDQFSSVMKKARSVLSPLEKEALLLRIDGLSPGEIAQKLAKNPKTIENALGRARRKLR